MQEPAKIYAVQDSQGQIQEVSWPSTRGAKWFVSSGDIFRSDSTLGRALPDLKDAEEVALNKRLIEKARLALPVVVIVDRDTCKEKEDGQVGEVWITGDSVTLGYYQKPAATQKVFQASLSTVTNKANSHLLAKEIAFIR